MKPITMRGWCYILISVCLIGLTLSLSTSGSHLVLAETGHNDPGILKAIVVMKSASGKSYIADRNSIASMPALYSEEEMASFISQYRADAKTVDAVIASLEAMGFTVTTHDDIFAFVIGAPEQFEQLLSPTVSNARLKLDNAEVNQEIFTADELNRWAASIDGVIVYPWHEDDPQTPHPSSGADGPTRMSPSVNHCPDASITVDEVMHYLAVDLAHGRGLTGKGVRIGFIDKGVYTGHSVFFAAPLDIQLYRFVEGQVTRVGDNFSPLAENMGHGTMVAAYLNAVAPQARLLSFAMPVDKLPWEGPPDHYIAEYINYMHTYNLVDVISLSIGWWEENTPDASTVPEIRTQMIYAIAKGTVVLVAAGNTGQADRDGYDSGHNVLAAIPEVIAVGGATVNDYLDFSAAGGYSVGGITGAASFDSLFFEGRHVPDVVGIFGDDLCFPYPVENNYSNYDNTMGTNGTSGATPQIAGMVALLMEQDPSITPTQVRAILEGSTIDITTGQSGDGDAAAEGYDAATGYGLPLATWVLNEHTVLYEGWNLIGLLKEHAAAYTAVGMLNEINAQGGDCTTISHWVSGMYKSVVIIDGDIYGFDFDLTQDEGYWVRCRSRSLWKPTGTSYVHSPHTLNLNTGWNLFAIPYANVACTADDVGYETGWKCWNVVEYDGQMQDWRNAGLAMYGNNFLLRAGKGYFVRCDEAVTWTPDCSRYVSAAENTAPRNVFSAGAARVPALAMKPSGDAASVQGRQGVNAISTQITNITDQQFSVFWETTTPVEGAVLLTDGYQGEVLFTAFDDRGIHFAGETHHVTIRGLEPETTYYYAVVSDGVITYTNSSAQPFQATTGKVLNTPSNRYDFHGHIYDSGSDSVYDAVVTAFLWSADETSTALSFPVGPGVEGYTIMLDNARSVTTGEYANYSSAEKIMAEVTGNAGTSMGILNIDLGTTPSVEHNFTLNAQPPGQPLLIAPLDAHALQVITPTFSMRTVDVDSNNLTYRLELSRDHFATIARRYDQRTSTEGWSASSYASDQLAYFTPPTPLKNLMGYQWRVFAYDGSNWSIASNIAAFSTEAPVQIRRIYLPLILRAN